MTVANHRPVAQFWQQEVNVEYKHTCSLGTPQFMDMTGSTSRAGVSLPKLGEHAEYLVLRPFKTECSNISHKT